MENDKSAASDNNYMVDEANNHKVYCEGESSHLTRSDFQTLDDFNMEFDYEGDDECADDCHDSSEGDDNVPEEEISDGEPTEEEKRSAKADELARQVRNELYSLRMSEGTPIADHLSAMEARFVQLIELGHPMDSENQNLIVWGSLNSFWHSLIGRNKVKTGGLSTGNLYKLLLSLEAKLEP